jgi:cell division protein FtsB
MSVGEPRVGPSGADPEVPVTKSRWFGRASAGPRPLRRRRRRLIAAVVVVAILAGLGAGGALAFFSVKQQTQQLQDELASHMKSGQTELEAAKSSLKQANTSHDVSYVVQAKTHFLAAKTQFATAAQIADHSDLLHRLEQLPDVGNMVRSRQAAVDGIAGMGVAISNAGLDLSDLATNLIKPPKTSSQQGQTLLTVLSDTNKSLVTIRSELVTAQTAAATVDVRVLPTDQVATFVKARDTVGTALSSIDQFQQLVPVLNEVLGGNGPRTYLIEQLNPAELRPGGGFVGTFSVLRADHGMLKLLISGSSTELAYPRAMAGQRGYVAPPGPLKQLLLFNTSWSFFDSNFFPDFTTNAQYAEQFAQPRLGVPLDGVIAVDYYTVAKMLELTGPVRVPGYGITLNAANFITTIFYYDLAAYTSAVAGNIHKAILTAVAGPLMNRVSTLPPASWPNLLQSFNGLATQRHLQAYFNNAAAENLVSQYGWSGALLPTQGQDYMMEVEANVGGTKANYYVTRQYKVELTRIGNTLHHKVTVDLVNSMPYVYKPNDFYRVYMSLFAGSNASSGSNNLTPLLSPMSSPANTRILQGWATLPGYGNRLQAVFEYDTPWQPSRNGREKIYWQKQPGTLVDKVDVFWNDGAGHVYHVSGDLGQDRVITVGPTGVTLTPGQQAQAQLPSLSLG